MATHVIIIEVDENKHNSYDCICENKRLMQLSKDIGHRPIVFIRFNPDKYVDSEGNTIKSCWRLNKSGGAEPTSDQAPSEPDFEPVGDDDDDLPF